MLLQYHGTQVTDEDVSAAIATGCRAGSHVYRVGIFLESQKVPYSVWYPCDMEKLKQCVAMRRPVMVPLARSSEEYRAVHAVLVTGYSDEDRTVTYHDPYYGPLKHLKYEEFDALWLLGGGYTRQALAVYTQDLQKSRPELLPFSDAAGVFEKGRYLVAIGKTEEAIPSFETVVAKYPKFVPGYLWLGSAYAKVNRNREAEDTFAKAVELDRSYFWGEGLLKLACAEVTNGKPEQGLKHLDEFISGNPTAIPEELRTAKQIRDEIEAKSTTRASTEPVSSRPE
jgi:tetratricopeptide (TPR) repeat protein